MQPFCVTEIESDILSGAIYHLQLIVVLRQGKFIWKYLSAEAHICQFASGQRPLFFLNNILKDFDKDANL
jgi:hypothetical protein